MHNPRRNYPACMHAIYCVRENQLYVGEINFEIRAFNFWHILFLPTRRFSYDTLYLLNRHALAATTIKRQPCHLLCSVMRSNFIEKFLVRIPGSSSVRDTHHKYYACMPLRPPQHKHWAQENMHAVRVFVKPLSNMMCPKVHLVIE